MADRPFEDAPDWEQMSFPGMEGDATSKARAAADITNTLNQQMNALLPLVNQMQQGLSLSADSIERMVTQLERIGGIQDQNNRGIEEETKLRDKTGKQVEANRKAAEAIAAAQGKGVSHTRELMREYDMYDKRSRQYRVNGQSYDPAAITAILSNPSHPDYPAVQAALQRGVASRLEKDTGSPRFRVGDLASAASRGDISGMTKELMQRGRLGGAIERGTENLGLGLSTRGGLAGRLGGRLMGLAPLLGGIATPAALIAGEQIYSRGMRQLNEARDFSMITGQSGPWAGFHARAHSIAAGLNPFDIVGAKDVMQAEMTAAQAGFRGRQANRVTDVAVQLRQDLGIPIKEASDLTVTAIRDAGMTFDEVRSTMGELDDATKAAGTSIEQMTQAVKTSIDTLQQFGRAPAQAAAPTIAGISAEFAGTRLAKEPGLINQFLTGDARRIIAQRAGFRIDQIYSPEFSRKFQQVFDKTLLDIASAKPEGMPWDQYVRLFMQSPDMQQLFGATPWETIAAMLNRVWKRSDQGTAPQHLGQEQRVTTAFEKAQAIQRQFSREFERTRGVPPSRLGVVRAADPARLRRSTQQALNSMRQLAEGYGLNAQQRQEILAPLRAAEGHSADDVNKALEQSRHILEDKVRTNVTVDFSPDMKKYIRTSSAWTEVTTGMRPAQGVQRWP